MSPVALLFSGLIRAYQLLLSPVLPASCRFAPSCSAYGLEAIRRHGAIKGGWLTVMRILRCHPWGGSGYDPVPERAGASTHDQRAGASTHIDSFGGHHGHAHPHGDQ